ncbi:MAG: GNAT family N-acetyltransferase [Actinomycetota bacterium]
MDRHDWIDLNAKALMDWFRGAAQSSETGQVVERPGVIAAISPGTRGRSVFNSVAYDDAAALEEAYADIASAYEDAGCAWTVWVPENDSGVSSMLARAGHVLDAQPRAMGMSLEGLSEHDLSGLDWTAKGDFDEACLINDRAYGYSEGTWRGGMGRPDGAFVYSARINGEGAATVMTKDHDGPAGADCSVWAVATLEPARGKGLASALLLQALRDATRRGCATTTLQATKLGRGIYERLGYQDVGALQMWELRPPELAGQAHLPPPA